MIHEYMRCVAQNSYYFDFITSNLNFQYLKFNIFYSTVYNIFHA